MIVTNHQRQGRVLHSDFHCVSDRHRSSGIAGDHHEGGRIGRGGWAALEGEAARHRDEVGHLGLKTIDHHRRNPVLHGHRHTHIHRTDPDGHGLIHVAARVVVGNAHSGGGDRRKPVAQINIRRTGSLDHQRLIFIHHQRQGGPLDSYPQCVADGQTSRGILGEHDQLVVVGSRSGLPLEGVITCQRHEATDCGVKPRHQHRRHLIAHHQRSGDADAVGTHIELLVQVEPGVVVREAHGLHTDPREAATQAQRRSTTGRLDRIRAVVLNQQGHRGPGHTAADGVAHREARRRPIGHDSQVAIAAVLEGEVTREGGEVAEIPLQSGHDGRDERIALGAHRQLQRLRETADQLLIDDGAGRVVLEADSDESGYAAYDRTDGGVLGEGQLSAGAEHPGEPVLEDEEGFPANGQSHPSGRPHDQAHVPPHHARTERWGLKDRIGIRHRHGDVAAGRRAGPLEGEVARDREELTQSTREALGDHQDKR